MASNPPILHSDIQPNKSNEDKMTLQAPIEYDQASPTVKAVYDDIMATRKTDWVNNFWKVLANHPENLQRTWNNIKQVMGNGALDPLTKELIYVAVSITNNCGYCIASHSAGARAKGMTDEQFGELLAVIGLANETNRLAIGYGVPIDDAFLLK
jgi:AhpD family alkylhydroperoxidase